MKRVPCVIASLPIVAVLMAGCYAPKMEWIAPPAGGFVFDAHSRKPITNAIVTRIDPPKALASTKTDALGWFAFTGVRELRLTDVCDVLHRVPTVSYRTEASGYESREFRREGPGSAFDKELRDDFNILLLPK